jgi:hypothetical protein
VTEPPSGASAPVTAELRDGEALDLRARAQQICRRYRDEFPDEKERYGDAGMAWCMHDNQHLLNWAVAESNGYGGFKRQLAWLAGVVEARDFPLERLARDLDIVGLPGTFHRKPYGSGHPPSALELVQSSVAVRSVALADVPRHGERELVPAFVVGVFAHELLDRPEVALDAVEVAGVGRRGDELDVRPLRPVAHRRGPVAGELSITT